jgi:hypothetical protein
MAVLGWAVPAGGNPAARKSSSIQIRDDVPEAVKKEKQPEAKITPEKLQAEYKLRIIALGGTQKDERYYLVDDSPNAITFEQLKDAVLKRAQEKDLPIQRIDILVYKNTAYRDSYLVRQLESWAKDNRLSVNFPPVSHETMPER